MREFASFLRVAGMASMSLNDLIDRLYARRTFSPKWAELRGALEHFVGGRPTGALDLGKRLSRKVKGRVVECYPSPAPLYRLVVDGDFLIRGSYAWKVESVPRPTP